MSAPLHVLVGGASGFLGTRLVPHLESRGHRVTRLVRRAAGAGEIRWDPAHDQIPADALDGVDVVVNLAGSPLIGNPHSRRWARDLRESRVSTTRVLAEAVAARAHGGSTPALLAGNGISWYGDHGDEVLTEASDSRGDALLTRVTREWQQATDPARRAGARVCILRTAVVLDATSMPFKAMRPVYAAGLGVRLGSGRQYFPVVSLHDWVGAVTHLAESPEASGPFNVVCPSPPTHAEYCEALAGRRRVRIPVPAALVRLGAGPMAPEVLGSVRAVPAALEASGYTFRDRDVEAIVSAATRGRR